MPKAFVVLNPVAGSADDDARGDIESHLAAHGWECEVYETSGDEDVAALARDAATRGADLCVAAGGDGTVSAVAGGLVDTDVPLGVLPVGTGNVLAQELSIPLDLDDALNLLTNEHEVTRLDMIRVGDRRFVLNVSAGIGSLSMRDTGHEAKQRLGMLAYALTTIRVLLGFQPRVFELTIDGEARRVRASEVMVANSPAVGSPDVRLGADVHLDDGRLDMCVVRARGLPDYLRVVWDVLRRQQDRSRNVQCIPVKRSVRIGARRALPVEADGEIIGETPVEATFEPSAVRVVVPRDRERH